MTVYCSNPRMTVRVRVGGREGEGGGVRGEGAFWGGCGWRGGRGGGGGEGRRREVVRCLYLRLVEWCATLLGGSGGNGLFKRSVRGEG